MNQTKSIGNAECYLIILRSWVRGAGKNPENHKVCARKLSAIRHTGANL